MLGSISSEAFFSKEVLVFFTDMSQTRNTRFLKLKMFILIYMQIVLIFQSFIMSRVLNVLS